jgi:hypothetical protein
MLLWSGDALHEASLSNEGKDMWRTYLDYQVRGCCCCCCGDSQLHVFATHCPATASSQLTKVRRSSGGQFWRLTAKDSKHMAPASLKHGAACTVMA